MYLEVLLIAQYTFQIPTRLRCSFITPELRDTAEFIGLHGSAVRCLPIFVLYLATLMHTYVLARWQVRELRNESGLCRLAVFPGLSYLEVVYSGVPRASSLQGSNLCVHPDMVVPLCACARASIQSCCTLLTLNAGK